jgi:purine-binding chemotaxis protein CheW
MSSRRCGRWPLSPSTGPRRSSFVAGVSIIRGEPVVVIDAAMLLGVTSADPGRLVVIRVGARRVALAVTGVLAVREIAADVLGEMPPLLAEAESSAVVTLGRLDNDLLLVLDGARLVSSEVWADLDRARVS